MTTRKPVRIQVPEIERLAPKTTETVISEIRSEGMVKSVDPEDPAQKIITVHPVKINIVTKAPIDTLAEAQQLYAVTKNVTMDLLATSKKEGKIQNGLIGWMKESREQLKLIHSMTEGFQQKMNLKKIDLMAAFINSSSVIRDDFKIKFIKELEQAEYAEESDQFMEIEE